MIFISSESLCNVSRLVLCFYLVSVDLEWNLKPRHFVCLDWLLYLRVALGIILIQTQVSTFHAFLFVSHVRACCA